MEGKLNSVSKELQTIMKQICETKKQIDNEQERQKEKYDQGKSYILANSP
jgi:flagellar capping protein FliD